MKIWRRKKEITKMIVGFIADLHIDRNFELSPIDYLEALVKLIKEKKLTMLIIGGDISNHFTTTIEFAENLQDRAEIPVYFIPGNHDFWEMDESQKNTKKIYQIYKDHPQSLIESPLKVNQNFTIVGHPAWYNYAVYDKNQFSVPELEQGKYRWSYWQDKVHLDWEMSDQEVSKRFADIIENDIKHVSTDQIILQTHIVTIPEFTMPMPHRVFDFFNAYMATDDLKDFHKEYNITHEIMGHIHFRGEIDRDHTRFITNSLGYRKEWRSRKLETELGQSLLVLDLDKE